MIQAGRRIIRAFFKALLYTLQGKRVITTAERYPALTQWIAQGLALVNAAYLAAEQSGMDQSRRQALRLKIDRRDTSAELILAAVRYHMMTEYPSLLRTGIEHNLTALYALNIDDQYRVNQLAGQEDLPAALRTAATALAAHLEHIPSDTNL